MRLIAVAASTGRCGARLLGPAGVRACPVPALALAAGHQRNQPPALCLTRSELARLGKEKLLFAAREALHAERGRTGVLKPSIHIEALLLPGAMALLHQVGLGRSCWGGYWRAAGLVGGGRRSCAGRGPACTERLPPIILPPALLRQLRHGKLAVAVSGRGASERRLLASPPATPYPPTRSCAATSW